MSVRTYAIYGTAGTAVSGTTTYYSTVYDARVATDISYVVELTGTPVGTLTIEVSNSTDVLVAAGTARWATYTGITIPAISGTTAAFGLEVKRAGYRHYRLKYVNSSSSGTIFVDMTSKAGGLT